MGRLLGGLVLPKALVARGGFDQCCIGEIQGVVRADWVLSGKFEDREKGCRRGWTVTYQLGEHGQRSARVPTIVPHLG